jgi:hypothetical protein
MNSLEYRVVVRMGDGDIGPCTSRIAISDDKFINEFIETEGRPR